MNALTGIGARPHRIVCACLLALLLGGKGALAQTDNFNGSTDAGWTHYDPFASFGAPATFSVANGQYTISAQPSPSPSQLGPSRAGSLRTDVTYSNFSVGIDLDAWTMDHDVALGILARVTNPGLGMTNGYAFTYSTGGHSIDLSKVTGEQPDALASTSVTLDPNQTYRLVLTGIGPALTGQVFNTSDLTTPVASISASDATYGSGINGLVVFDNTNTSNGTFGASGTYDNYAASVPTPEPVTGAVLVLVPLLSLRKR